MFSHVNMSLSFSLNCSWDNICKAKGNSDLAWSYEVREVCGFQVDWSLSDSEWQPPFSARQGINGLYAFAFVQYFSEAPTQDLFFVFCWRQCTTGERRKNIFSCSLVLRAFWILPVELKKTVKIINPVFERDEFTFRGPASSLKRRGTDERERWMQSHTRDAFNKEKQRDGSLCWAHLVF